MSQDDLAIRLVMDPTQFREEMTRLRRDLEDQQRIDIDRLREERKEEEYERPSTVVEIRKTVAEPIDVSDIRRDIDGLRGSVEELKAREGLPAEFGGLTIGEMQAKFEAAKEAGWFDANTAALQRKVDKAVRNMDRMLDIAISKTGEDQIIDSLYDTDLNPIRNAMIRFYTEILTRHAVRGRLGGLGGASDRVLSDFFKYEKKGGEGFAHRLEKALSDAVLEATGKTDVATEYTTYEHVRGKERGPMTGRFDIFALFETGAPGLRGANVVEALGGMMQMEKTGTAGRYAINALEELYYDTHPTLLKQVQEGGRDPVTDDELTDWIIQTVIPQLERAGAQDYLKMGFAGTAFGSRDVRRYERYAEKYAAGHPAIKALRDAGYFTIQTFGITQDEVFDVLSKVESGEIDEEEAGIYLMGKINQSSRADAMRDFFNTLIVSAEEYDAEIKAMFQGVIDTMVQRERRPTRGETRDLAEAGMEAISGDVDANLTDKREALARLGAVITPKRRGKRPRTVTRVRHGLERYADMVLYPTAMHLREEEEQVTRLVGAGLPGGVEEEDGIRPTDTISEIEELLVGMSQRAIADEARPEMSDDERRSAMGDVLTEIEDAIGHSIEDEERGILGDAARLLRDELGFQVTGVPMEFDPKEHLVGLKKVAAGMDLTWKSFTELVEARSKGKVEELFQGTIGSTLAIIGATVERAADTMSERQAEALFKTMTQTPMFMAMYQDLPSMDPVTGRPEPIAKDAFLKSIREGRVRPEEFLDMAEELRKLFNSEEIKAMVSQQDLVGLHQTSIQIKRAERATMDLEPAFGGSLDYWT